MKNTIQKILITLAGLVVSFGSCTLGMYLVFLADEMKFGYYILFSAIFILNPITTVLMAVNMFRRPKAGAPSEEKGKAKADREEKWEAKADREEKWEAKAAKEVKKPKEVRNPFKKEPRESGSSKKDEDLSDVLTEDKDAYKSDIFSSKNEIPDPDQDDDIFSTHVTADDEDQFPSE